MTTSYKVRKVGKRDNRMKTYYESQESERVLDSSESEESLVRSANESEIERDRRPRQRQKTKNLCYLLTSIWTRKC